MFCSIASSVTQARPTSHRCRVSANIVSDDQCHGNGVRLHSPVRHAVLLRSYATAVLPSSVFLKEGLRRWAAPLRRCPIERQGTGGTRGLASTSPGTSVCGGGQTMGREKRYIGSPWAFA